MDTSTPYRSLLEGEMLSWYRIERILGQGGFGVIYLATDTNLDHLVAIKEYRLLAAQSGTELTETYTEELDEREELGLQRFISEARNLVRFKHPNIVRVMSVFEANDTAYMVMEFEEGVDLREHFKESANLGEEALKSILEPVSKGLIEVHNHGFIHRDIKPANILVRKNGTPVLLDFGSARNALPFSEDPLTALISAGYSPLEQYSEKSDEQQGPWTDIYALGAVLYYAISGAEPVDSAKRASAILNGGLDPLIPARLLGKDRYSDSFLEAIDWALSFRIQDRPQSVSDWMPAMMRKTHRRDATRRVGSTGIDAIVQTDDATSTADAAPPTILRRATLSPELDFSVDDPLEGLSMRDQPVPREVEAARAKRTSKRSLKSVSALLISGVFAVAALAFWHNRESISSVFAISSASENAQTQATVVDALTESNVSVKPSIESEAQSVNQAKAAQIEAEARAEAKKKREQQELELAKQAEEAEQKRIDAIAEAAAIATTKQIAAQKKEAELAKQAAAQAASKQLEKEQAAIAAANERSRLRARKIQLDRHIEEATSTLNAGQLDAAERSLDKAAALNSADARVGVLRTRLRAALVDSRTPVSDAEFDQVIERFDRLRRALETNEAPTMNALTERSNQNALFTQLMSSFTRLEVSISRIRVRNANKSITATLRIEKMVRSNGDQATPSTAYRERTIVSQRKEGQWSLIRW